MTPKDVSAYEALTGHAKLIELVSIARDLLGSAVETKRAEWADAPRVKARAEEVGVSHDDAATELGNVLTLLEHGPRTESERALGAALWAHALSDAPPKTSEDEDRTAAELLWLAARTPFDATGLIDRALGDAADEMWAAIADRVRRIDAGTLPPLGRGEALAGCAALAASTSPAARKQAATLSKELLDVSLKRVVAPREEAAAAPPPPPPPPSSSRVAAPASAPASAPTSTPAKEPPSPAPDAAPPAPVAPLPLLADERITGEMLPTPRGPVATAALALTGILFVLHAARLVGRFALAYKRTAEVTLTGESVRIHARTEMLGRTLRERDTVISRSALARATREVRYPRMSFYAGLLALAVGSYVGVATLVDGVRSASPSLLLTGLVVISLGIALDFFLGSLAPGATGRVRVAFVPRKGPTMCVGNVDAKRADAALKRLSIAR
jgi:hypothetical protein